MILASHFPNPQRRLLGALVISLLATGSAPAAPNVLFIVTEDLNCAISPSDPGFHVGEHPLWGKTSNFDHDADLLETRNLAGDERHRATIADLARRLHAPRKPAPAK